MADKHTIEDCNKGYHSIAMTTPTSLTSQYGGNGYCLICGEIFTITSFQAQKIEPHNVNHY